MGVSSRIFTAVLLMASLALTACSVPGVRAVEGVRPVIVGHELLTSTRTNAGTFSVEELNGATDGSFHEAEPGHFLVGHRDGQLLAQLVVQGRADAALDSTGEGRRAWPLDIDLGVEEFPLDDGMHPVDGHPAGRSGFSSSLVRLTWREPLVGAFGIHGSAALARTQEEPLTEALTQARLSWFTLGFHASF
ncbi:hypothetical protein N9Z54_08875 [Planctomycetota bacterium]|nr:hypothetical protein [Planctomycetota bacterium]